MSKATKRSIWGWAMYDWANSAFATTVMAGFFPIYFKQFWSAGADASLTTARLGLTNSAASLIVALMAPVLGAIADRGGARKKFLLTFAYLGVAATAGLFWIGKGQWQWAALIYAIGIVGFSGGNAFYDALLPAVADESSVDRVSSLGFGLGYLGGGLLFLVNVAMVLRPAFFGLADDGSAVRWAFMTVAVWWGGFSLFTLFWVPEKTVATASIRRVMADGWRSFKTTVGKLSRYRAVWMFLIAYWLYIDGVDTIVRMAVDYGLSLGFEHSGLISALLLVQFVAFPATLLFGRLGERWGVRRCIYLAICIYLFITVWGVCMDSRREFFVLAALIGCVQGGIQALSRSYYTRLIPSGQEAEFFGFYNMLGKFAAILGPALMGGVALLVRRMLLPAAPSAAQAADVAQLAARWSLGSVALLFIAGAVVLYWVPPVERMHETE